MLRRLLLFCCFFAFFECLWHPKPCEDCLKTVWHSLLIHRAGGFWEPLAFWISVPAETANSANVKGKKTSPTLLKRGLDQMTSGALLIQTVLLIYAPKIFFFFCIYLFLIRVYTLFSCFEYHLFFFNWYLLFSHPWIKH